MHISERKNRTSIPRKSLIRLAAGIREYPPILAAAKARDVDEADTVTTHKDMLSDDFL